MVKKKIRFFTKNNKICGKLRKMANFAAANLPLRPQKTTMTDKRAIQDLRVFTVQVNKVYVIIIYIILQRLYFRCHCT